MGSLSTFAEHALFSPSQPSWLNYDDDQLIAAFCNSHRAELGTEIHEWASVQINLKNKVSNIKEIEKGVKTHIYEKYSKAPEYRDMLIENMDYLPHEIYPTIKLFINDSIGYMMLSEQKIVYSDLFWGTADAIKCANNFLQVFDLKTGSKPAKEAQLYTYAALYCLQEHVKPDELAGIEIRIYQAGEVYVDNPTSEDIYDIMSKITHADTLLNNFRGRS